MICDIEIANRPRPTRWQLHAANGRKAKRGPEDVFYFAQNIPTYLPGVIRIQLRVCVRKSREYTSGVVTASALPRHAIHLHGRALARRIPPPTRMLPLVTANSGLARNDVRKPPIFHDHDVLANPPDLHPAEQGSDQQDHEYDPGALRRRLQHEHEAADLSQ